MSNFFTKASHSNTHKLKFFNSHALFPILTAKNLLSSNLHQKTIEEIKKIVGVSDEHFDILYNQLIKNFAEFVQLLPVPLEAINPKSAANVNLNTGKIDAFELPKEHFDKKSKLLLLLNEGLLRAIFALQLYKNSEGSQPIDPLMTYVLFSASLLCDVSLVNMGRTIIISNKDGSFIEEWIPYNGSMSNSIAPYYHIRLGGGLSFSINHYLTPLIAKKIMTPANFNWIARDSYAFNIWISLLTSDETIDCDVFRLHFKRAKKMVLSAPQQELPIPVNIKDILEPANTYYAEEFLDWLNNGIENGTITINTKDSKVHIIGSGIFLELQDLLSQFLAQIQANIPEGDLLIQLKEIGFLDLNWVDNNMVNYNYRNQQNILYNAHLDNLLTQTKQTTQNQLQNQQISSKNTDLNRLEILKQQNIKNLNIKETGIKAVEILRRYFIRFNLYKFAIQTKAFLNMLNKESQIRYMKNIHINRFKSLETEIRKNLEQAHRLNKKHPTSF